MTDPPFESHDLNRWVRRPSGARWDSGYAVYWPERTSAACDFTSLRELLRDARQGVFFDEPQADGVPVRIVRGSDVQCMRLGDGEHGLFTKQFLQKHLATVGDVLISRVGRQKAACCVTEFTGAVIPRDSVLIAKPITPHVGASIAAALNSNTVQHWLLGLSIGLGTSSLTIEELCDVPIPQLRDVQVAEIHAAVQGADSLVEAARQKISQVRGEVGIVLEGAPVEGFRGNTILVSDIGRLRGWSWQDAERDCLGLKGQQSIRGLQRLGELITLKSKRVRSSESTAAGGLLVNSSTIRSDEYLANPVRVGAEVLASYTLALSVVDSESLLIPAVGNIAASPAVIPQDAIDEHGCSVSVPGSWMALTGLRFPRAWAVLLDHPFIVLQRRLSSAYSTVPHITREEIAELLVPAIPNETMSRWEVLMKQAHAELIDADRQISKVLAKAEEWYS